MDLELIASPHGIALDEAPGPSPLWNLPAPDPNDPDHLAGAALPSIRGLAHMGLRVPDLDQAREFFVEVLGCQRAYRHATLVRSGGQWAESPDAVDPAALDYDVPDDRFATGTRIRIDFVSCDNFNFELMELQLPDHDGVLRPAFDRAAAAVMRPMFQFPSPDRAIERLERAGASLGDIRSDGRGWLTPWGQAVAVAR